MQGGSLRLGNGRRRRDAAKPAAVGELRTKLHDSRPDATAGREQQEQVGHSSSVVATLCSVLFVTGAAVGSALMNRALNFEAATGGMRVEQLKLNSPSST